MEKFNKFLAISTKVFIILFIQVVDRTPICSAANGRFTVLTYNVAGLLEFISSAESPRSEATSEISCYINPFDIVNVQEDFNYHRELYETCNNHTFKSRHTGPMGIGSGLNTLSHLQYTKLERRRWGSCIDADCLTPKGFTLTQVELEDGVYIHLYNLHAQAADYSVAQVKRRRNYERLRKFIEENSKGEAVIIMGDFNVRYTTPPDNESIRKVLDLGFSDTWVELIRKPNSLDFPQPSDNDLGCNAYAEDLTRPECEVVDKILFRSNGFITLEPVDYQVKTDDKNGEGVLLSDHAPVFAEFAYQTNPSWSFGAPLGGVWGGYPFNDMDSLLEQQSDGQFPFVTQLVVRGSSRILSVEIQYSNGFQIRHGASTSNDVRFFPLRFEVPPVDGSNGTVTINPERLVSGTVCKDRFLLRERTERVFFVQFVTSLGRTFSVGERTDNCHETDTREGQEIFGFHGRAGQEVDNLGFIFRQFA